MGCNWTQPTLKPRMIPYNLELVDLDEGYMECEWQALMDSIQRGTAFWAQSINRQNCNIAMINLGDVDPSTYDGCFETISIPMELNMHSGVK